MYSQIFGYAVTEGSTFAEKYFPGSQYWNDVAEMERTCLLRTKYYGSTSFSEPRYASD